ncbi:MAG: FAD-dependent oxidoreductase, partial [Promethearchaeota archaeon]
LEYERILCPTGPFGMQILRPSDETEPKKIAFIQCAGSGYLKDHTPYCSRVCCMYTAKNAILTKDYTENTQISVFRHNIRVFGRTFYEYTKNAQVEHDIKYINSRIGNIEEEPASNDLIIHYKDMKTGKDETYRANLVVLAAPLVPSKGAKKLAKILEIELDQYEFFKSQSYFNKSLSTKEGIYLCGFNQSPMNISETVANASGIAGEIATLLAPVRYSQIKEREIDILPEENIINITPRALVIGGGVSGMTAALILGKQGFETILLEKENKLGGNINSINILYPTKQSSSDFLFNLEEEVRKNTNIEIVLNSKIENITGSIGKYEVSVLDINNKIQDIKVGIIIIATGSQEFKPTGLFQYNKDNRQVLTLLELERKLKNKDISWLNKIKHITIILCVKARQKEGFSYCSNVCCSNAIKNINIIKEINPKVKIVVLFRDLHMAKKELEEIFSERKNIADYARYNLENIPEIVKVGQNPEKYLIKLRDENNPNQVIEFNSDLIILATPMIPPDDIDLLSGMLDIPLDENGFFIEAHTKLRPLDFAGHGIFICGCAQWPKNIQDCISEANGAAGRASRFLSLKKISTTKLEILSFLLSIECFFKDMRVNVKKCNGCGRCAEVCQFKAISLADLKQEYEDVSISTKKAHINPAICKGCGKCSATCRLKAINPRHYDFKQISAIIDPYFLEKAEVEQKTDKEMESFIIK